MLKKHFVLFIYFDTDALYIAQAVLELLSSGDPLPASRVTGTTGHYAGTICMGIFLAGLDLTSGLCTCKADTLPLEPHFNPIHGNFLISGIRWSLQ
jgi:hypothetical protein